MIIRKYNKRYLLIVNNLASVLNRASKEWYDNLKEAEDRLNQLETACQKFDLIVSAIIIDTKNSKILNTLCFV